MESRTELEELRARVDALVTRMDRVESGMLRERMEWVEKEVGWKDGPDPPGHVRLEARVTELERGFDRLPEERRPIVGPRPRQDLAGRALDATALAGIVMRRRPDMTLARYREIAAELGVRLAGDCDE